MRLLALVLAGASCLSGASVSIQPGTGPAGGYLPLTMFGMPAITGVGDNTSQTVSLIPFSYGGVMFGSIAISSNGYITMGDNASSAVNQDFPDPTPANGVLAPFWTNLDPTLGGEIRVGAVTDGVHTWDVIDWEAVRNHDDTNTNSFEIWLLTGGTESITFSYGLISAGDNDLLTVGAETLNAADGVLGAARYFNETGIAPVSRTELTVTTVGLPNVPEPGTAGMLGGGFLGLVFALRRRLRRA
jgi:hypothetical protein